MPSIYQRARGVWRITVELGADPVTGRRRRLIRDFHGSKKEAQAEQARILHERSIGEWVEPHKLTVAVFLERWLVYMDGRVSESTLHGYRKIVQQRLSPDLGGIRLQQLGVAQIARVEERWRKHGRLGTPRKGLERGLTGKTVLNFHRVLQQALADAVRWKLISHNPADDEHMEPPTHERKPQAALSLDEAQRLLGAIAHDRHGPALHTALSTGLRAGEILGLRWNDVNLDLGVLRVQQAYNRALKQVRDVKTHRSRRPVSLDADLVSVLRRHQKQQLERQLQAGSLWQATGLVFTDNLGGQVTHAMLRSALDRCLREAGLSHISPHGLRHTHASLLIELGAHIKLIQERLGHASFAITADTYSHIQPTMDVEAAAQLGRALRREDFRERDRKV